MQIQIMYRPSYSLAAVKLDAGETIRTEAGAMVSMTPGIPDCLAITSEWGIMGTTQTAGGAE